ncbi:MAG: septum formation protein Maf [Thermoproteales archaeon]|nr:septum formation protein Maf [Thermoproteales archaeon]
MEVVLASLSPARKRLLEQLGFKVTQIPSGIKEAKAKGASIDQVISIVTENAKKKAEKVYEVMKSSIVIAADTVVYFENKVLGKPQDAEEARQMLKDLRGKWHSIISGYAVYSPKGSKVGYEITGVKMRNYSDAEIEYYLSTKEYVGKAGAYAIQGMGAFLVEEVRGCFYNIAGLPIRSIIESLAFLGYWPPSE